MHKTCNLTHHKRKKIKKKKRFSFKFLNCKAGKIACPRQLFWLCQTHRHLIKGVARQATEAFSCNTNSKAPEIPSSSQHTFFSSVKRPLEHTPPHIPDPLFKRSLQSRHYCRLPNSQCAPDRSHSLTEPDLSTTTTRPKENSRLLAATSSTMQRVDRRHFPKFAQKSGVLPIVRSRKVVSLTAAVCDIRCGQH